MQKKQQIIYNSYNKVYESFEKCVHESNVNDTDWGKQPRRSKGNFKTAINFNYNTIKKILYDEVFKWN